MRFAQQPHSAALRNAADRWKVTVGIEARDARKLTSFDFIENIPVRIASTSLTLCLLRERNKGRAAPAAPAYFFLSIDL